MTIVLFIYPQIIAISSFARRSFTFILYQMANLWQNNDLTTITKNTMTLQNAKDRLDKLIKKGRKIAYPQLMPHLLKARLATYMPFVGAGIRVETLDLDNSLCVVVLPLTKLNQNIVGTQFGGSLFMMTDPFFMMMLMARLGKDYVVWDKKSTIDFIKAADSKVTARMNIDTEEINTIIALANSGEPVFREYQVDIIDSHGKIIAKVHKTLYIRLRSHSKSHAQTARFE